MLFFSPELKSRTSREISNAVSTLFLGETHCAIISTSLIEIATAKRSANSVNVFNYFEQLYFHEKMGETDWKELDKVKNEEEMTMFLESMKEHFAKVRYEGILEGERKGRLEGRLEGKQEIAKAILAKGLEVNFITEVTGLSIDDIEQLML